MFGGMPGDQAAFEKMSKEMGVDPKDAMKQAEEMMNNPQGAALMEEMASKPKVGRRGRKSQTHPARDPDPTDDVCSC